MEIFNIGPLEFLLIVVIALIVLGPEEMAANARKIGKWVNKVIRSPFWKEVVGTSQEIRDLPQKIIREAQMEDTMAELKKINTTRFDLDGKKKADLEDIMQGRENTTVPAQLAFPEGDYPGISEREEDVPPPEHSIAKESEDKMSEEKK
jgi:Sec-independent protein translocase protein TatA